jgi:hypothetical protein
MRLLGLKKDQNKEKRRRTRKYGDIVGNTQRKRDEGGKRG